MGPFKPGALRKPMRVLLTGATGTAGSAVLRACIADPRVTEVLVVGRRAPEAVHRKVEPRILPDLGDWAPLRGQLGGLDAVLWCLGVSQSAVARDELRRVTVDFTVAGARAVRAESPQAAFLFLSGGGADPRGRSRLPFAIEKGRAETALDAMGFARLHHFRPGYIHPERPGARKPWTERVMARLAPVVRAVAPGAMVDAGDLARAMVRVAVDGHPLRVLENRDVRAAAGLVRGARPV
ncbi:MAG: hypothetical protein QOD77_572 [Thermoplasmata archaeon]|jgi:uncharacterized protein YbjT (DUF2867 family)|nr:hypothetical protein [Thermoplasmata archaeon]